jgi:poly(hydroxyalkanoate) depolymerase family esterase
MSTLVKAPTLKSLRRTGSRFLRMTAQMLRLLEPTPSPPPARRKANPKPKPASPAPAFAPNPGALTLHTYAPPGLAAGKPLVVLLHGCGQNPEDFATETGWRALAQAHGFALLMPGQTQDNNAQTCFNWFRTADVSRDHGEAASIAAMTVATIKKYRCNPKRVFATGLSAGGAMTACVLAAYPDLFAAGAVVAGLPAGSASNMVGAMTRMAGRGSPLASAEWASRARVLAPLLHDGPWPRLQIWCGDADQVVAPVNAAHLALQWTALHKLNGAPVHTKLSDRVTCDSWGAADTAPEVQVLTLAGAGHVYPTKADQGISAAAEIARFWGVVA